MMRIHIIRERLVKSAALVLALALPSLIQLQNIFFPYAGYSRPANSFVMDVSLFAAVISGTLFWIVLLAGTRGERFLPMPKLEIVLKLRIAQLLIALAPYIIQLIYPLPHKFIQLWVMLWLLQDFIIFQIGFWGALIGGALPGLIIGGIIGMLTDALVSLVVADPSQFKHIISGIVMSVVICGVAFVATLFVGWLHLLLMRWVAGKMMR